jgi:ABC-2 type transport system permease protein
MIGTVFKVSLLSVVRDRVALVLTFVLPLVFFSVFAAVFAPMDTATTRAVKTIVVADSGTSFSSRLADRMAAQPSLVVERRESEAGASALAEVRAGRVAVVLVLPIELQPTVPGAAPGSGEVELHADRSNPLAAELVRGLLQSSAAELLAETHFGAEVGGVHDPVPVRVIDAVGAGGKQPSISFFAAGLGVMFLMFAVAGRSAILLEERENGVLGRLMAARVGMTRLLLGHWLFLLVLGATQVLVMFVWAALVFGLDLFTPRHFAGFAATTIAVAAAAAAFGLILSAACRTRAQLNGVAVVVILTLSVIGGNMFPSFLMPEGMQAMGRWTFNAWALEAYRKVFWYDRPLNELLPQIAALLAATVVFLALARWIGRRWERAGGMRL